jgi:glycerophosphoryl diester phosphodiesterase
LVNDGLPARWLAQATRLECVAIHANQRRLDESAIAAVTGAGFALGAYTVNATPRARELWQAGVGYVFTDDPAAMLAARAG